MLRQLFFGAAVCMASVAMASDAEDVQSAIKKLADNGNYTWKTTTESANGGPGGGGMEGKTEKDGYTTETLHFGDNEIQIVVKGSKGAVKLDDGWKTADELAQDQDAQGFARFAPNLIKNFKTPAAMADETASKVKEVKKEDDYYTVEISGDDAKPLMTMGMRGRRGGGGGGGQAPQIANAKISMKIWVKDGVLTKYTSHATGTITINGEDRDIDRTTTTEFTDVGSTKVEVPDEVKKKLES
jgi:hypothetical protein